MGPGAGCLMLTSGPDAADKFYSYMFTHNNVVTSNHERSEQFRVNIGVWQGHFAKEARVLKYAA